jgi:hypothetical protein
MPLLSEILNKHIDAVKIFGNKENLKMIINIDVSDEEGYYCYYYFSRLYYNNEGLKYKLQIFKEIEDNIFLGKVLKKGLQIIFCKLQKLYYCFARIAYLWRYKKATYKVTDDLSLNPIDIHKKNVFVLFQNNSKYLFVANDLINIINKNLMHSPNFFCDPLWIKNPYNNIELTLCDLYNIYFFLKFKICNVPILFELFFKSKFCLELFVYNNQCVIRSIKIDDYVKFSDNPTLYKSIMVMITENINIMHKIKIDKEFPRDLLIKIMRPYLHLYITSKYAIIGTEKRCISEMLLKRKLHDFAKFNPLFGRKKITTNFIFNKMLPLSITFNDKHINFYKTPSLNPVDQSYLDEDEDVQAEAEIQYEEDDEPNIIVNDNSRQFIYDSDSDSDSDSDTESESNSYGAEDSIPDSIS